MKKAAVPKGSVRTTISIPGALKARMSAVQVPVNWSHVAAMAFEVRLGELAHQVGVSDMSSVVERLRASKVKSENAEFETGQKDGRRWAEQRGSWAALRDFSTLLAGWNDGDWESLGGTGWLIPKKIDADATNDDALSFWNLRRGQPLPSDQYVRGYFDAVLEVFEEVRDQV